MEYMQYRDFMQSLRDLQQKGGLYSKAANDVQALIGRINMAQVDPFSPMRVTKHGENRIKKCVKYDLIGHARLITIRDNGVVLLCFAGDHTSCDAWLDNNRGFTLIADEHSRLGIVLKSPQDWHHEGRPTGVSALTRGKLFEGLPETYFERLIDGVPRRIVRALESLESINEESDVFETTRQLDDTEKAQTIYDAFVLLRQDKRQEALERVKLFFGEVRAVEALSAEEIERLAEGANIKTLRGDDPRFKLVFQHFVKSASYMDWMLFLHPDQQEVVDRNFSGPVKLTGVSGSGKTCIVVRRAVRLAQEYVGGKVLVLTLNRQLARLIEDMMNAACPEDVRPRIDVMPFFSVCQKLLEQFEPGNDKLYDDVTWKSGEHIDAIRREYYRCEVNNHDARVLLPLHDSLIARNVNAEQYILEEFDWIRSAVPISARENYLRIERRGRSHPLDERFRTILIDGLGYWEKKMRAIGVTDYLGLSTALYAHKERITPEYRCILVDESQDFGTIEYRLIRTLVPRGENDLFFCGDAAQQISAKQRSFADAGIEIPSARVLKIEKNYRNSREILRAAFDVLYNNLSDAMLDSGDFDVLEPQYANFSAAPPLMLRANDLEGEIAFALAHLGEISEAKPSEKACIAICGQSLYKVQKFGERLGISVLNGTITIDRGSLYLSDLEHTKGFEFDTMVILNCNRDVIPDPTKPEKEQFRDLARFYVAMTRAKSQLIVSYSTKQSSLLANSEGNFLLEDWDKYVGNDNIQRQGIPPSLDDIRYEADEKRATTNILDFSGPEFLYTDYAIGLSSLLIDKLRNVVSGRSVIRNGVPIEWPTLRKARADTESNPRSRQAFGPEGIVQFRELLSKHALAKEPEYREE